MLGDALLDKFKNALSSRREQYNQLTKMEEELDEMWLNEWQKEVESWEADSTRPNPYEPRIQGGISLLSLSRKSNRTF